MPHLVREFLAGVLEAAQGGGEKDSDESNAQPVVGPQEASGSPDPNDPCGNDPRVHSNPAAGRHDKSHRSYDDALNWAREQAGDLGLETMKMFDPVTGTLIGERSLDGKRGWRIDFDHVNYWDWRDGKRGQGGRYGHSWYPGKQSGPHSCHIGYSDWE